jgi:hypothetical protein
LDSRNLDKIFNSIHSELTTMITNFTNYALLMINVLYLISLIMVSTSQASLVVAGARDERQLRPARIVVRTTVDIDVAQSLGQWCPPDPAQTGSPEYIFIGQTSRIAC